MPNRSIPEKANNIDRGIARATIKPGAKIAEEDEQDGDDHQPAFKQVLPHGVDHMVHQLRAVVDALDRHARRERGAYLFEFVLQRPSDIMAVLAHEHEAQAEHRLAAAVGRNGPQTDFVAGLHVGHVADVDRHAVLGGDDDVLDLRPG